MARKTITQKVMEKVMAAPKARIARKTMHVLDHKAILKLSKSPDSATRRLREKAQTFTNQPGNPPVAYEHKDGKILILPQFVNWMKKQ